MPVQGDAAFLDAYDTHVFQIYGFFAYRLGSRTEADDLTQATFERALKAWNRYDPSRASVSTWLMTIAQNLLIDHFRKHANAPLPHAPEDLPVQSVEDEPFAGMDAELAAALAQLSDREREIIALRFGADLSGAEIAAVMALTVANVHQLLSRSLSRLRALLDERPAD